MVGNKRKKMEKGGKARRRATELTARKSVGVFGRQSSVVRQKVKG
jgi:hypothetical protein